MSATKEISFNLEGSLSNMGLPVKGGIIRLYDYWHQGGLLRKHFLSEEITDAKGSFSFNVRKGVYSLEILPGENSRYGRQSIESVRVTGNKSLSVVLKAGFFLSGTAKDSKSRPLEESEMLVFGIEPYAIRTSQTTDGQGLFNLCLPPGKYYLSIRHQEKAAEKSKKNRTPFLCPFFETIDISADCKHDIKLPELVGFKGKISNLSGHPVSGVKVMLAALEKAPNIFADELPAEASTFSRTDGSFEFSLKQGNYSVRLLAPEDSGLAEKNIAQILVDADCNKHFSLEPGSKLYGRVMHDGSPVPNVLVTVSGENLLSSSLSNEEGEYSFCLPRGSYDLTTSAQPDSLGALAGMNTAPKRMSLVLEGDSENNIEMEEGVLVTGIVQDASKRPCPGVQLSLYTASGSEVETKTACRTPLCIGITGDDGTYEFRLKPDRYWLVLNNQSSSGHYIDVTGDRQSNHLTTSGICLLDLELSSESGDPVANCRICVKPYERLSAVHDEAADPTFNQMPPVFTDSDGRCRLAIAPGIYSLDFLPPEHSSYKSKQLRQLSVAADIARKIRLESKTAADRD